MQPPLTLTLTACAALAAGCTAGPPAAPAPRPAAPVITSVARGALTASGQPLRLPQGSVEVVIAAIDIPAGGRIPAHRHPWSRYVYVERGRLRVTNLDTGAVRELGPGEALIEVVDQWHEAQALGPTPVRLISLEHVPAGATNTVRRDPDP